MRSQLQSTIFTCLILLLPTGLFASNSAMLTAMGPAGPSSSALFAGDVVATQPDALARRLPYYDPISTLPESGQAWWRSQFRELVPSS